MNFRSDRSDTHRTLDWNRNNKRHEACKKEGRVIARKYKAEPPPFIDIRAIVPLTAGSFVRTLIWQLIWPLDSLFRFLFYTPTVQRIHRETCVKLTSSQSVLSISMVPGAQLYRARHYRSRVSTNQSTNHPRSVHILFARRFLSIVYRICTFLCFYFTIRFYSSTLNKWLGQPRILWFFYVDFAPSRTLPDLIYRFSCVYRVYEYHSRNMLKIASRPLSTKKSIDFFNKSFFLYLYLWITRVFCTVMIAITFRIQRLNNVANYQNKYYF